MEKYDLSVRQGETFRQELVFRNSDGTARDLTGYQGFSQVRPDPESDELICSMECFVDGEHGTVILLVGDAVTKTIPAGCYAYDFAMRDPNDYIRYYIGGKFAVIPAVTEIQGS